MQDEFNQKTPIPRIIVLIVFVILLFVLGIMVGYYSKKTEVKTEPIASVSPTATTTVSASPSPSFTPSSTSQPISEQDSLKCSFWSDKEYGNYNVPIDKVCGTGTLKVAGKIIKKTEQASWAEEGVKVDKIYLAVNEYSKDPEKSFFDCFYKLVKDGNTVNDADGEQLLFKIGILQNNKLISSASITEDLKLLILENIGSSNTLDLILSIPQYEGAGVGDEFSFACKIAK